MVHDLAGHVGIGGLHRAVEFGRVVDLVDQQSAFSRFQQVYGDDALCGPAALCGLAAAADGLGGAY